MGDSTSELHFLAEPDSNQHAGLAGRVGAGTGSAACAAWNLPGSGSNASQPGILYMLLSYW